MLFASTRIACQRVAAMAATKGQRSALPQIPALLQNPAQLQRPMTTLQLQQPQPYLRAAANSLLDAFSTWIWHIKRTFQPSLLRKKRKYGYLRRKESVGGRKILKRRMAKKRARLFGA